VPIARGEGGADIHYEVHGTQGSPVVLSAGMGGSGRFWAPQVGPLARRHRVLVYDHVGTGRSTRAPAGELGIARMARDVVAVLDAERIGAAHFVGHAIGGIVGLALALDDPARLLGLVPVNAWARADAHLRRCFDVRREILLACGPRSYVRAQPLFLYPPQWIADHDAQLEAEAIEMTAHFPSVEVMMRRIAMFLEFDALERLGSVRAPTLVVSSRDDMLVPPSQSDRLAAGIPGARHLRFEHGGHASTAVAPEPFNDAVLAFLAELDAAA
jgi:aminoacrylate hydrolase